MESDMLLVKADALSDVFKKVVEAKKLIAQKKAKSATEAAKICGISRSAFYKYKDSVFPYKELSQENIVNISAVLEDRAGVLSLFISAIHEMNANILTINQGMPSGGVAQVTVSYHDETKKIDVAQMLDNLSKIEGVVTIEHALAKV